MAPLVTAPPPPTPLEVRIMAQGKGLAGGGGRVCAHSRAPSFRAVRAEVHTIGAGASRRLAEYSRQFVSWLRHVILEV